MGVALAIGTVIYSRELDAAAAALELDSGPQSTLLYDRNGRLLFSLHDEERTNRRLQELSPSIVPAVLVAEDRHFWSHHGIDPKRIAGAAWVNLKQRGIKQGASTITQQLVRSQALGRERTWSRKWREILLALRIERRFTKEQILETYLNRIYLGDSYFGIEAAARGYFNKDASALNDSEAALLAGIIKCPSACSPRSKPEKARARRDMVLRALLESGKLSASAVQSAMAETPKIEERRKNTFLPESAAAADVSGLYFIDGVRRQLIARFGEGAVLRGGLRVYTTLDVGLQRAAEEAIARRLHQLSTEEKAARLASQKKTARRTPLAPLPTDNPIEGSLVAIDPRSGEVLALVGGHDFRESPYNRAIQAERQPGSAFKPILFAAALEQGFTPSAVLDQLDSPIYGVDGEWLPTGEHEAASYTLRQALVVSSNRAAARLIQLVGVGSTQYYARQLGIESSLPSVPSLALGTAEVSLIDLTSAYGVFANAGVLVAHTLITRVEDGSGQVLWRPSRPATRAIRSNTAFLISTMLADSMNRGTGAGARANGFKLPAAGKTGTTDNYADAWFVGYTPSLVTGVWFGRDRPDEIARRGFAGTVAVPAWADFMKQATANAKPVWFPVPPDLEKVAICEVSGLLATPACQLAAASGQRTVVVDYVARGSSPREPCSVHVGDASSLGPLVQPAAPRPVEPPVVPSPTALPVAVRSPSPPPASPRPVEPPASHQPVGLPAPTRPVEPWSAPPPVEPPASHQPVVLPAPTRPVEPPSAPRPVEQPMTPIIPPADRE